MDSIGLLKKMISVDSSTREQANQLIDFSKTYLEAQGIEGQVVEQNGYKSYVATLGAGDKTLVLNGHLDVVSGKPSQFVPSELDGKLFGRGSADMKSGCAAMIQAFIRLRDMPLKCKVMLQLVTDEEIGGFNCSKYLADQGYIGDFVICTEPTQLNPSIQSKGMIKLDILTRGKSAHGSRPWEGENAIERAFENFKAIQKLAILREGSALYESSTVNLALIKGGDIYNRVPESCTMGLDIRYVPHVDPQRILRDIEACIEGEIKVINVEPGVLVEPDHPYIDLVKEVITSVDKQAKAEIVGQHGGSDARFFASQGIPAIELGPKGDFWHGDGEYVDIQSVLDLEEILIGIAVGFQ